MLSFFYYKFYRLDIVTIIGTVVHQVVVLNCNDLRDILRISVPKHLCSVQILILFIIHITWIIHSQLTKNSE
ncbi:hypothetical protein VNO80_11669 [Phaseolus coccineus]|uniref:Uncharacterized protein n=1 Tax=Phaseolus coccineus TaxID=3886 RepID=A0AAN9NAU9_PHACN